MTLKTGDEYKESVKSLKLEAHVMGKKSDNLPENPLVNPSMKAVAVTFSFHHPQIQIRISLLFGSLATVAFGIGHGAIHYQILELNFAPVIPEALVVMGSAVLINIIGCAEHGVGSIQSHTTLEATAREMSAIALHQYFFNQIIAALMQMGKAVDLGLANR